MFPTGTDGREIGEMNKVKQSRLSIQAQETEWAKLRTWNDLMMLMQTIFTFFNTEKCLIFKLILFNSCFPLGEVPVYQGFGDDLKGKDNESCRLTQLSSLSVVVCLLRHRNEAE